MKQCLLIDGNSILFRAYFAFQRQRLKTKSGKPSGALYGFLRMLLKMLKDRDPDLVAVAFDTSRDTFRRKIYPEYKAKRRPTPEDLLAQIPAAHEAVRSLGISVFVHDDYEADDLIGSAAQTLKKDYQVQVLTGDRDLLQLIDDQVLVELCQKGVSEVREVDYTEFEKEYGFGPRGLIELKALMGDSSDNIPGVKGIGVKKGLALVQEFATIDNLYGSIEKVANEKMRQKLIDDREMAYLSHDLATIRLDVKCFDKPEELKWSSENIDSNHFLQFLAEWDFGSLYSEISGKALETSDHSAATDKPAPEKVELTGERLLISSMSELEKFFDSTADTAEVCLDIETDGLDPILNQIVGVSFAFDESKSVYVPLRHSYLGIDPSDQADCSKFFAFIAERLKNRLIIGHNLKFDLAFLETEGIIPGENIFDTLIAAYVIDPTRSNGLKALGANLLGVDTVDFNHVAGKNSFAQVDLASAKEYACQDTLLTLKLYPIFKKQLLEHKLEKLYQELEMPLVPIIMSMERIGIGLNSKYLANLSQELSDRLTELEAEIHSHANKIFNINSTKQLQEVLFQDLGLEPPRKTKTGYSTDSDVLRLLSDKHPICKYLLEFRELGKLKSTYTDTLNNLVNPKTNCIHASFNQTVTATGRLSSSNPNMQNIPIKTEWGRKIRRAFLPPRPGHVFVSIDYSQIELRLLAHFSLDPALIEAYTQNTDIHAVTAARIFAQPLEEVTSEQRSVGKTVNFGILYGISAHGLAADLAISRPQAKEYIDSFYNGFTKVTEFFDQVVSLAQETLETSTLLGRIRRVPDINAKGFQARSAAERVAKNTRLQGSAADLVKKAMIDTAGLLSDKNFQTALILQIHDELVFSVPENELKQVAPLLKECMENTVKLNVPLVCDMSWGRNLADLEPYEF